MEHLVAGTELVLNTHELLVGAVFLTALPHPIVSPSLFKPNVLRLVSNMDTQFQQVFHLP